MSTIDSYQLRNRRIEEAIATLLLPIQPLLDMDVIDVMRNPNGTIYTKDSNFVYTKYKDIAINAEDIHTIAALLASQQQNDASELSPIIEASWHNLRFSILLPPLTANPSMTIRKKTIVDSSLDLLVELGTITHDQQDLLRELVLGKRNIIVSGGTASGKTTLANALIRAIPPSERLYIIEDSTEINPVSDNIVQVLTGAVTSPQQAVKAALRQSPDRIIVGEVRDGAALELLKAWNTGHSGGISTIHANSVSGVWTRLRSLIQEVSESPQQAVIDEAVQVLIHMATTGHGCKVMDIEQFSN